MNQMKLHKSIIFIKNMLAITLLLTISACSWVKDDLDSCDKGVKLQLRVVASTQLSTSINSQIYFDEAEETTVYVYDANNAFVGEYKQSSDELRQNNFTMSLPLNPGTYHLVVWSGADKAHYDLNEQNVGVTNLNDHTLTLKRDQNKIQADKLLPLWQGNISNVVVKENEDTFIVVNMKRDTNTLVAILQDTSGNDLNSEDYSYEITSDNGTMNYRNELLADDRITYPAYFVQTAQVGGDNEFGETRNENGSISVARAELNTLRLMTDHQTRFTVRDNNTGKNILNINLTEYLLLTRELATVGPNKLSDQEYLDYQYNYSIIFFLTPTGNVKDPYVCLTLNINGWIIRLNNSDL